MNQIWFIHVLGLNSSATRSAFQNFKITRSILVHRNVDAPSASTVAGTAGAEGPAYYATLARELAVQSTSGPDHVLRLISTFK